MKRFFAVLGAVVILFAAAARAQVIPIGDDKEALRAEQIQIFNAMFETPDDLDLMFRYALVSIRLEDLEAAISTLERMLIYNKDLPRVHMELGAAYYRLGSYETSEYYFNNVLEFQNVPPQVATRAREFLRAIDQRTQESVVTGSLSGGVVFASNATLGPDDPTVLAFGQPAALGAEFLENDDLGVRLAASLSHFLDLGQPDSDFWRSDFSVYSLKYFEETRSDIVSVLARSGPRISLDDQQFGPKLRPFAEFDYVRAGEAPLYATASLGAEYSDTLSDTLAVFGSARAGYRDYIGTADTDGDGREDGEGPILRATAGAAYIPSDDMVMRGALFVERVFGDGGANASTEATLRGSATYNYDSGYAFAGRLWSLTGFAQGTIRAFDAPNAQLVGVNGGRERRDIDLRVGLRHTFYLKDGVFVAVDGDLLHRDSNILNFDLTNFGAGLTVGFEF